ncbi:hypothetical protein BDP55DRAFT_690774 [Colletotrichum godetiae]|uniref:Uncharacterized protein n=1 Tax=Colletotrichum godetiae TaxID=1209918 RepID=A0AAJ0AWC9_9PEZI|nr:uncharacterized protein BDP55DRAFT_690774 [Colletotrichum godetiae]KAK1691043.1 hypothetical protein BDP55DRAFT_690774 [Colletotrichum godetiae]
MASNVDGNESAGNENTTVHEGPLSTDEHDGHADDGIVPISALHVQASLRKRAPTGPIPERTWNFYLNAFTGLLTYENILDQRNQCIRSRRGHSMSRFEVHDSVAPMSAQTRGGGSYPYPAEYRRLVKLDGRRDIETGGRNPLAQQLPKGFATVVTKKKATVKNRLFGIFPRGQPNPVERVMFCHQPKQLFRQFGREIFRLRGFWKTLFSLRHVKGFQLYKCNAQNGTHERIDLDKNGAADLQLLLHTYKQWRVPEHIALAWADWIHQEFNNDSHDVLIGKYSLELVLGWSITRIVVVILTPVVLSLVIGLWFNSKDWMDLTTIQTAWSTASYIVTAGGFIAALLGIMSSLADN